MEPIRRTFTIEHCLGRGGFGEVYRAEMLSSTGLSTSVAVKVLRRDVAPDSQAMQRLKDEGAMLARLNHPTILRVHDLVILEGRVSLVTEFVDGEDLERCLRGATRIGPRALVELVGQVASALDAALNSPVGDGGAPMKLVHRDIKPSNIRIGRHGEVKLLDFGIARSDEVTREAHTVTNMMVGSPPYMAPERFLDGLLRASSDVFSLGAIVLEGLIGRRVFDQPVPVLAALGIEQRRYEAFVDQRFDDVDVEAPPEVVALARQMLSYVPEERPTAAEVARRCEALVDVIEGPSLTRWCRERKWREPPRQTGDLDGRVVSEGTLARQISGTTPQPTQVRAEATAVIPPTAITDSGSATRTRGIALWVGGASVLSSGLVLALTAIVGVVVFAVWVAWPDPASPGVAPVPAPIPAPIRAPVEAPVPPVVEEPAIPTPEPPDPAPPDRTRVPPPRPPVIAPPVTAPDPVEVAPSPPAAAPVVPKPSGRARVRIAGDALTVELEDGGKWVALPGSVAPGTYPIRATFANGKVLAANVAIGDDPDQTLNCTYRFWRCTFEDSVP